MSWESEQSYDAGPLSAEELFKVRNVCNNPDAVAVMASQTPAGGIEFSTPSGAISMAVITGLVANDVSAAAANLTRIQACVSNGGGWVFPQGKFYVNDSIIVGDNTQLDLTGCELAIGGTSGYVKNVIRTACADAWIKGNTTSVTLTWVSGSTCSVAWAGHGRSKGDYVFLYGTAQTQSNYQGVFAITSVTDANNFVVQLWRTPSTAPSGAMSAVVANRNITLTGGKYNQQYPAINGAPANPLDSHAMILGGVAHLRVRGAQITNANKYGLHTCGLVDAIIEEVSGDVTGADIVKIYGPCVNVTARHISGNTNDDVISVQGKEPAAYLQYMYAWGDCINVTMDHVSGVTGTSLVCVYSSSGQYTGGVKVSNVTGRANKGVYIYSENASTLDSVQVTGVISCSDVGIAIGGATAWTANSIALRDCTYIPQNYSAASSFLHISAECTIGQFELANWSYTGTLEGTGFKFITYNTIKNLLIQGGKFDNANTALWQNNGVIEDATVIGAYFKGLTKLFSYTGSTAQNLNVIGNKFDISTAIASTTAPLKVYIAGNDFIRMDYGVVRTDAAVACSVTSGGGNRWNSQPLYTVGSATGTISVYGFDIPLDVGGTGFTKTVSGQHCYNTGSGRGTLAQNRLVTCNGTNWIQVDDTTKSY